MKAMASLYGCFVFLLGGLLLIVFRVQLARQFGEWKSRGLPAYGWSPGFLAVMGWICILVALFEFIVWLQ